MTDDRDASIGIRPQARATGASFGVPLQKLSESDTILRSNIGTALVLLDHVEFVAVADHARLNWVRSFDAFVMSVSTKCKSPEAVQGLRLYHSVALLVKVRGYW